MQSDTLLPSQVDSFRDKGYCVVRSAVPAATCSALRHQIQQYVADQGVNLRHPEHHEILSDYKLIADECNILLTPRLVSAVRQLFGRWSFRHSGEIGLAPIRTPIVQAEPVRGLITGWHVDGPNFRHRIDSTEQALVILVLLNEVDFQTGGTQVRIGSHWETARVLAEEPDGLELPELVTAVVSKTQHCSIDTVTGHTGDAILIHGMAVHAGSINNGSQPRVMLNTRMDWGEQVPADVEHPIAGPVARCMGTAVE